jgi:hypothetical protein
MMEKYTYDKDGRLVVKYLYPDERDNEIYEDAIDLIKKQDAEIAALKAKLQHYEDVLCFNDFMLKTFPGGNDTKPISCEKVIEVVDERDRLKVEKDRLRKALDKQALKEADHDK